MKLKGTIVCRTIRNYDDSVEILYRRKASSKNISRGLLNFIPSEKVLPEIYLTLAEEAEEGKLSQLFLKWGKLSYKEVSDRLKGLGYSNRKARKLAFLYLKF